ncbi:uncharacterized protein Eint_080520 [Encephalitozoon intestinalis ATCC 50506]|uniref:Uncharacterized protein n=1 Tax=Encephalitozoon intestinalis (strain ATCC 50506) TaxID=876142 RepID=E0S8J3_ENCIT|nr:uncharacterized protein Eint_080520 [Encephalitozoon intestinalis ATCC 50506]ADM11987.1 hypothetical protein Eint_080520 [Encephalitozoon intestinalis ATCC 50506]UTX45774.1 hypothetical protein GPK93_08g13500 [Encephalitozoon intestinalis]
MKIIKSLRFGSNSLTPKLLAIAGIMMVIIMCMMMFPSPKEINSKIETPNDEFQTRTYLNASKEMREELKIKREDFEGFYFTLRLINPMRDRVVMIVNGTKIKTIVSSKYIIRLVETIDNEEKSPFYFIFLSYLIGSLYFPAGTINFISNSEGVWYNGVCYTGHPSIFRRICLLLIKDIK